MRCSECGAMSVIDKRPLVRASMIFAAVGAVYLGGLLWAVFRLKPVPSWLVAHAEIVAVAWFLPFLLAAVWTLVQLFRVPLKVVASRQSVSEI